MILIQTGIKPVVSFSSIIPESSITGDLDYRWLLLFIYTVSLLRHMCKLFLLTAWNADMDTTGQI